VLQALHQGPALRQHVHQCEEQVQKRAGVRMLAIRSCRSGLLALAMTLACSYHSFAQTAFRFEGWRGYYTVSADKQFRACFIETDYWSGDTLKFWLTPDLDFFFSLEGQYKIDPNQRAAKLWVDGADPLGATIDVKDEVAIFSIGKLKLKIVELYESIRMGNTLFVEIGGQVQKYNLKGSYGALSELFGCANQARLGQPPPALPPPNATNGKGQTAAAAQASAPPQSLPPKGPDSSASAFAVAREGYLLTNAHAVEGCREVLVSGDGAHGAPARIVATDKRNDLALLQAKDTHVEPIAFRKGLPRLGESVFAYGYPLSTVLATSGNFTAGMVSALVGMRDDSSRLQVSAPVQPGNSGGPLLDSRGAVVGVVVAKLNALGVAEQTGDIPQNVNFAIKGAVARTFLEAYGVEPILSDRAAELAPADIADIGKAATLHLECFK